MKIVHKGEYGYISYQKKWTIIRTAIYFAICIAIFVVGYITTGSRRNLLTIVAVLGCLPACKSFVNVVMFLRAKGCSEALHSMILETHTKLSGLYDLYLTSYKTNFDLSHMIIAEKTIIGVVEVAGTDTAALEKHIEDHLKQDGCKDMMVKIFSDKNKYVERINQLSELDIKPLAKQDEILEMLLSISL